MVVLPFTQLFLIHQVSKWLWRDGNHIGKDETAVAAGCQNQLVMAVVVTDTPNPGKKEKSKKLWDDFCLISFILPLLLVCVYTVFSYAQQAAQFSHDKNAFKVF